MRGNSYYIQLVKIQNYKSGVSPSQKPPAAGVLPLIRKVEETFFTQGHTESLVYVSVMLGTREIKIKIPWFPSSKNSDEMSRQ